LQPIKDVVSLVLFVYYVYVCICIYLTVIFAYICVYVCVLCANNDITIALIYS